MNFPSIGVKNMTIEDRIDQLSRLALAIILIVTLGLISLKGQGRKLQESTRKTDVSRLVARPSQAESREGLVSRPKRLAKAI
jgi:hypothetical protein